MNNKINAVYPKTEYIVLNQNIKRYISLLLEEFMNNQDSAVQPNFDYELNITYEKYQVGKYLSFAIKSEMSTGGAHPNHRIDTIIYDIEKQEIVNIESLMQENKMLLVFLSEESRKKLEQLGNFKQDEFEEKWFLKGTAPTIANFKNIAFTKEGIVVYFPRYQIAPYYKGEYKILLPIKIQ